MASIEARSEPAAAEAEPFKAAATVDDTRPAEQGDGASGAVVATPLVQTDPAAFSATSTARDEADVIEHANQVETTQVEATHIEEIPTSEGAVQPVSVETATVEEAAAAFSSEGQTAAPPDPASLAATSPADANAPAAEATGPELAEATSSVEHEKERLQLDETAKNHGEAESSRSDAETLQVVEEPGVLVSEEVVEQQQSPKPSQTTASSLVTAQSASDPNTLVSAQAPSNGYVETAPSGTEATTLQQISAAAPDERPEEKHSLCAF